VLRDQEFPRAKGLGAALEGVSMVLLLIPIHMERVSQVSNLIKRAKKSGNDARSTTGRWDYQLCLMV